LHDEDPVAGIKGTLITFVNRAIEALKPFG
jgi:hypothetical protein